MRIRPDSRAFTVLLGSLAALPPLSIDMGLPALGLLQTSLQATASQATRNSAPVPVRTVTPSTPVRSSP